MAMEQKRSFSLRMLASRRGRARLDLWLPDGWPDAEDRAPLYFRFQAEHERTPIELGTIASLAALEPFLAARRQRPAHHSLQLVVWAPASEVLLFYPVRLPARSARTLVQALPYALEDQLLEEPETLHFAYARPRGEELAVAVGARARIERWLAALNEASWPPDALCPAVLSLPLPEPGSWCLACLGETLLVRQGQFAGFACLGPFEAHRPPAVLAAALAEARAAGTAPARLVHYDPPPPEPISLTAWSQALAVAIETAGCDFRSQAAPDPRLDLRQGAYAPRGRWRAGLRPLWPAAAVSAAALLGTLVLDGIEWWQRQRTAQELARQMHALYVSAFPRSQTVLDPYRQMRRELERLEARAAATAGRGTEGANAFLALFARAAVVLKEDPRLTLAAVRYQAQDGLVLVLEAPMREAVLDYIARLRPAGLAGEPLALEPGPAGGIRARVQIPIRGHDHDGGKPERDAS